MTWYEKDRPTPFDAARIEGLYFLDGDALARKLKGHWSKDQKYPMIAFPSGLDFPLWVSGDPKHLGVVHLFGEMDLPYQQSREDAYQHAQAIAEAVGYVVKRVRRNQLEVRGYADSEHYLISYHSEQQRMADVERLPSSSEHRARHPGHVLMSDEIKEKLPALYSNEEIGLEAIAPVKYFTPDSNWTWYASEGSPVDEDGYFDTDKDKTDFIFFGLVVGHEIELGHFSLSQLQSARGPMGLPIERDLYYEPKRLKELLEQHRKERGE